MQHTVEETRNSDTQTQNCVGQLEAFCYYDAVGLPAGWFGRVAHNLWWKTRAQIIEV